MLLIFKIVISLIAISLVLGMISEIIISFDVNKKLEKILRKISEISSVIFFIALIILALYGCVFLLTKLWKS